MSVVAQGWRFSAPDWWRPCRGFYDETRPVGGEAWT